MKNNRLILFVFGWVMLVAVCFQLLDGIGTEILDSEEIELVDQNPKDGIEDEFDENYLFMLDCTEENQNISIEVSLIFDLFYFDQTSSPFLSIISPPPELA